MTELQGVNDLILSAAALMCFLVEYLDDQLNVEQYSKCNCL